MNNNTVERLKNVIDVMIVFSSLLPSPKIMSKINFIIFIEKPAKPKPVSKVTKNLYGK
jgi:hypothetical protein